MCAKKKTDAMCATSPELATFFKQLVEEGEVQAEDFWCRWPRILRLRDHSRHVVEHVRH